ncbi:DUF4197 domain-containing protein [Sulfuriferula thiophila]|uniref:DUF4197 domain-containing protein n=1 Tax=Sulfuriferula thiophila TaxID=1781211 RepID=UPI000F60E7D7|nr:DUF4197 domain-containing protein [Sulfuriferula thiophila]
MRRIVIFFMMLVINTAAFAAGVDNITDTQASSGLKQALIQGATNAVNQLGRSGGFQDNPQIKIPLPPSLQKVEGIMRTLGQGQAFDDLNLAMNRAAEASVPAAKTLLINAVKNMTLTDAKNVLTGGDSAGTEYFRKNSEMKLQQTFLPIVSRYTQKLGLAQQYNQLAGQAAQFGLVNQQDANIERYITQKTLDGLYLTIANEERSLRANPVQYTSNMASKYGSTILKTVFGAIQQ